MIIFMFLFAKVKNEPQGLRFLLPLLTEEV